MASPYRPPRLLIVPGLYDSGPAHWQSWLQQQYRDSRRVVQRDFSRPDLQRWADRIQSTLASAGGSEGEDEWLAVAHSFGALALARHLDEHPESPIRQVLLVAPAEPDKFGVAGLLPHRRLAVPSTLIASQNDPWMSAASAQRWAGRWAPTSATWARSGTSTPSPASGPSRWPSAGSRRPGRGAAREHRPEHASFSEWAFAV